MGILSRLTSIGGVVWTLRETTTFDGGIQSDDMRTITLAATASTATSIGQSIVTPGSFDVFNDKVAMAYVESLSDEQLFEMSEKLGLTYNESPVSESENGHKLLEKKY